MPVYRYRLNLGGQEEIKLEGITFIKGQSIEYTEDQYDLNKYVPSHLDKWIDGVLHNSENPVHFDETYQDIQNVKEILEAADLLVGIDAPNATTQELTDGTVTDARLYSPAQIKEAVQAHAEPNSPYTFTYNADGSVATSTNTVTGEVTAFTYTLGVLTSLTVTLGASVKTQTFTYTNGALTAVSALA